MKPILTTLTALAVILAASTGAEAGKGPMVNINIKPKLPSVQIRPTRILPRLPVGTTSRLNKKREQPSEAADGGPQPEPPTYPTKRTRPRTAKATPAVNLPAPLPHSKPPMPVAVIDPDDLMTIPPALRDVNAEDLQKLKDFQDMATNGPNNAAPDVFGPRQDGRPGDEQGYGGSIDPLDRAADQAEANQENRDKQLDDFRATFGFDPANPGGGDTRQGRDFHTPAKNPGAAGSVINDPREMASDGATVIFRGTRREGNTVITYTRWDNFTESTNRYTPNPPDEPGNRARNIRVTTGFAGNEHITRSSFLKEGGTYVIDVWKDSEGNWYEQTREWDEDGNQIYDSGIQPKGSNPDSQPGAEGSGHNGNDNCGWNPMSGCTKKSTPIWKATVQPGAHRDADGPAAGPSLGQEAVTNTGDSTFDSGVGGGGGGDGRPDPCRTAGGCGGPIGDIGGNPGAAS